MIADYHLHTAFSDDSQYPMEEEIRQAIRVGIDEICFTEHTDYGIPRYQICDDAAYRKEFERCKLLYGDKIRMKFGMEFGMQTHSIPEFRKMFERNRFDFVILSCHQVDSKEFWTQEYQRGKTQREYNRGYYQEIYAVMQQYKDYSVLGHLDAIKRYDRNGEYPFEEVSDLITDILKLAIQDGKGIEVNTSCFRYGLSDLTPARDIIRLYRELGGEIITVGSDSHAKEHVGCQIRYVYDELKKMGFDGFYIFTEMKPEKVMFESE